MATDGGMRCFSAVRGPLSAVIETVHLYPATWGM
jgi:hypothetical protein